ncbi:MAG: iron-containing alcohol dehydrogenase, partial [Oscillospiraceae bacterium]|nr:iron-containing alcohol dehydrogenase [Oscillospiraceae bacterium]
RLLDTLPDYHRKASMLDALCHAMESFWSLRASPESRDYARQAIELLLGVMDAYLRNDPAGNLGMLTAANLAGRAIDLTQTTAGHAMCYGLTGLYGLAHGHAAALCVRRLWPYMVRNVQKATHPQELENTFRALAEAMGCASAEEAIGKYDRLLTALDLPAPRAQEKEYAVLLLTVNAQRLQNNPVPLDEADIEGLYRQIL